MISEGSCDTEDWSNDAENSDLHRMNKLYLKKYSNRKKLFEMVIIFHNITVFTVFTFTFMYLADAFIQSDLHCIQVTVLHFISSCFPWESNP